LPLEDHLLLEEASQEDLQAPRLALDCVLTWRRCVIAKPKQEIIKEEGDWEKASDSFEGEESEEQEDEEVTQKKESLLNGKL